MFDVIDKGILTDDIPTLKDETGQPQVPSNRDGVILASPLFLVIPKKYAMRSFCDVRM